MATTASSTSILFTNLHTSLPSSPSLSKLSLNPKPFSIHLHHISNPTLPLHLKSPNYPPQGPTFQLRCSLEEVALLENPSETQEVNQKRKLYVVNLPFNLSADEVKNAFSECGTVKEVELIKTKTGRNKGFAFVTMSSGDEAQAAVDKLHSKELSGRTIRVEFSKRLKKPPPPPSPGAPAKETRHKLYVSNLQWKVRSTHLREFFSANFSPVSARVVFESDSGRSAGYGFVSFSTREEAEAAISSMDGKELLGRPVRLKFSERITEDKESDEQEEKDGSDESVGGLGDEEVPQEQPENAA